MSSSDLIVLFGLVSLIIYWLDSIRGKENATRYAKADCKKVLVEFLDDTVLIKKVRLRRNTQGQIAIYREYEFEFSSTGEFRYKGLVKLLGKHLDSIEMEPYEFNDINLE